MTMAMVNRDIGRFIYPIIGFFLGLFLFYKGFSWFKRKRLIEDIPTSKIRSIAMGLVEVKGKALQAKKEIKQSPLSGKKCIYYRYLVEKLVSSGKSSRWVRVKQGRSDEPFFVEDETGKVMVDPKNAEVHVPMSYHSRSKWGRDPEPAVKRFLQKENIRFEGRLFGANYTMRYREWLIAPKMQLYIMGTAADNPYVEEATAVKGVKDIIIKRGREKVMVMSNRKEKQILNTLKLKAIGGIAGGALLSVVCLILIIAFISAL